MSFLTSFLSCLYLIFKTRRHKCVRLIEYTLVSVRHVYVSHKKLIFSYSELFGICFQIQVFPVVINKNMTQFLWTIFLWYLQGQRYHFMSYMVRSVPRQIFTWLIQLNGNQLKSCSNEALNCCKIKFKIKKQIVMQAFADQRHHQG